MSERRALLEREILFFGGKGGVGKTTLAASFALLAAERGLRTLLVSTDPAHSAGDILEASVGPDPTEVGARLWAVEVDPVREADRYIAEVKSRIAEATPPRLLAEVERQIDIARVSPGAEEAAVFDRFTRIMDARGADYDRIVFDTAPLGHTLRLLSLPEHMQAWMEALIGRRRKVNVLGKMWRTVAGAAGGGRSEHDPVLAALEERMARFARARAHLSDERQTAFVFVLIPERLPVVETERAVRALTSHGIPVGAVIVNRVLPAAASVADTGERRRREAVHLAEIDERFSRYPRFSIPQFEQDVYGIDALQRIVAALPREER